MSALTIPEELTAGDDRPDWCPEGVWPGLVEDMILLRAGIKKHSMRQIAAKWNLPEGKVIGLSQVRKWGRVIQEFREGMGQRSMLAAERAGDSLLEDLADEGKLAKMSIRDKAIVAKQMSENALNLNNGVVGSPGIGLNFNDIKILLATNVEKPVVVEVKG